MSARIGLTVGDATLLATEVLAAIGTPRDMAEEIARHLVDADRVGHGSHGLSRLSWYVDYVDQGIVIPGARPEIIVEGPSPVVSANWGFSHVGARLATDLACEQAQSERIGMAGLVRSTHLGRLGAYMERACEANCVALAFVGGMGGSRLVAPFGGRRGLLGTNPIAAGFPTRSGAPLVMDFSTASAPIGKAMVAAMAGERMPSESLVDRDGRPTDDPNVLENGGAMRTFGDHKGFGLAVLIELLGRILLGSTFFSDGGGGASFSGQGLLVIAIAGDAFRELTEVLDDAEHLRELIHAAPAGAGFGQVFAPGDLERAQRERHQHVITVNAEAWQSIRQAALRVGIPANRLPDPAAA